MHFPFLWPPPPPPPPLISFIKNWNIIHHLFLSFLIALLVTTSYDQPTRWMTTLLVIFAFTTWSFSLHTYVLALCLLDYFVTQNIVNNSMSNHLLFLCSTSPVTTFLSSPHTACTCSGLGGAVHAANGVVPRPQTSGFWLGKWIQSILSLGFSSLAAATGGPGYCGNGLRIHQLS